MIDDRQEAIVVQLRVYATVLRQWAGRPDLTAGDLRDIADGLERQAERLEVEHRTEDVMVAAVAEQVARGVLAVERDVLMGRGSGRPIGLLPGRDETLGETCAGKLREALNRIELLEAQVKALSKCGDLGRLERGIFEESRLDAAIMCPYCTGPLGYLCDRDLAVCGECEREFEIYLGVAVQPETQW
ncbi:MAG: hypothetical protein KAY24_01005 [Candidatus Eisenbacteria sp.]|nr:hypothetical protein [Candidatus Eisenbacteria bacterium]